MVRVVVMGVGVASCLVREGGSEGSVILLLYYPWATS